MKHPTSDDILEYYRGELSARRAHRIEGHLEVCDSCRSEWASLQAVGEWLATWEDEPVAEGSIAKVRSTLEVLKTTDVGHMAVNGRSGRTFRPWLRRAAMAAAVMAAVLLFQTFVWNPIKSSVNLRAVFNLSTPAFALPAGQAVPDTILVLTVYPDETFSAPMLEGRYQLDELIARLKAGVKKGQYRGILLISTDTDNPVSIDLKELDPLKEELGVDDIHVGSGVVGVASVWFQSWSVLKDPKWIFRGKDLMPWPTIPQQTWIVQGDPRWNVWSMMQADSLLARRPVNLAAWAMNTAGGQSWFISQSDELSLKALTEANGVMATVTEDGRVILSRTVLQPGEVEDTLKGLQTLIPDLVLTILVQDEENPEATELRLESIARRLGIENVTFKRVKKP